MAGGPARSDWRREKAFQVDMRNWKTANLDLFANPAGFSAWQYLAIGMLSGNRTDVRRLFEWAELNKALIDAAMAQQGAEQVGLTDDVGTVSYILFEAMKQMLADSMLNRARTCGDNGLQLWRALAAEYKGSSDQVLAAKAQSYQYPPRCATLAKLWEELPRWEQTGHEMATSSLNIHPVMKAQALNHLAPESLCRLLLAARSFRSTNLSSAGSKPRLSITVAHFTPSTPPIRKRSIPSIPIRRTLLSGSYRQRYSSIKTLVIGRIGRGALKHCSP